MRILHTAYSYAPQLDGVAEVVRHISEGLAQCGHKVHVATTKQGSLPFEESIHGVQVHRFAVSGNGNAISGEVSEFQKFVQSIPWDIVVNHCLQSWPTDVLLNNIPDLPWPAILVTHGLNSANPAFRGYYRDRARLIPYYSAWVTVAALNEEFGFAEQHGLADPVVIRNGIDLGEWSTPLLGVRKRWRHEQHPWLLNVLNHSRQKGHERLFELASLIKGTGAMLTILGNPRESGKPYLRFLGIHGGCMYACRMRACLSRSIALRVHVPRAEVVSAIREADVVVSTSRWEANSLVLLESMAAGTPWVSLDVGSARENAGGIVAGSVREMGEAVAGLLRNPELRARLGQEGRLRAEQRHDWRSIVRQYEHLYRDSIRNWRPGKPQAASAAAPS